MQLHSLIISEPAGVVSGFAVGLLTYYSAHMLGIGAHASLILGCIAHFITNTVVGGHINLMLLDILALVVRLPFALGSSLWMHHLITAGSLF
jgi:hypothetical protein